jgi:hypothetical protein
MHNGVLFSHKEEGNYIICRKMDRNRNHMLSEISQAQKHKYSVLSHMWNLDFFLKDRKIERLFGKRKGISERLGEDKGKTEG